MEVLISSVIMLSSVLLILVVYIQNPKGGGLSTDFGAAHQLGGVQKTNDFIDKATWTLAAVIGILSITLTFMSTKPMMKKTTEEPTEQTTPNGGQPAGQPNP